MKKKKKKSRLREDPVRACQKHHMHKYRQTFRKTETKKYMHISDLCVDGQDENEFWRKKKKKNDRRFQHLIDWRLIDL